VGMAVFAFVGSEAASGPHSDQAKLLHRSQVFADCSGLSDLTNATPEHVSSTDIRPLDGVSMP
jgi:hypothetical protein